jgi:hypothetical protein
MLYTGLEKLKVNCILLWHMSLQLNNVDVLEVTNMGAHTPDNVSKAFPQNSSYNPDVFSLKCLLLLLSYIANIQLHLHLNSISELKGSGRHNNIG